MPFDNYMKTIYGVGDADWSLAAQVRDGTTTTTRSVQRTNDPRGPTSIQRRECDTPRAH